tara:strand:- start:240 stop:1007 length:768 start_codon:yes stop_codon:yes gene_type:complete
MEIIPAIDLLNGRCVRLHKGNYKKITEFNEDPIDQALKWEDQGAERIHIVDLDGAKTGSPANIKNIKRIAASVKIPIQIGGGVRTLERAKELIESGVDRVILGTIAIENKNLVKEMIEEYPYKIVIGIDSKKGYVATNGWITKSQELALDLAKSFNDLKIAAIVSTDISKDGTLEGPNISSLRNIAESTNNPIIASGGVGKLSDLLSLLTLEEYGVKGVIVGRAIYDGSVNLKEAINMMKNKTIQDIEKNHEYYA